MVLIGKAVRFFLDELDNNLGGYTPGHKGMFSSNPDYLKVKELYSSYGNKADARFIIEEALNEFDRSRHNIKREDWQMTNDHYVELCESYPGDFALTISRMFYQELYERDNRISQTCKEENKSLEEVMKILLDKGM